MAFSKRVIKDVQEKAAFKCCRCQSIGVEVHHIIPQKDKGPDTFENAAPLCPSCHSWFGDNPVKRKEMTHMRDWWYEMVERTFPEQKLNYQLLNEINTKVEALTTNQDRSLADLKDTLKKVATETIEKMTFGTASSTATGIANATIGMPTPDEIEEAGDYWIQSQIDIKRGK